MMYFIQATLVFQAAAVMLIITFAAVEAVSHGRRKGLR